MTLGRLRDERVLERPVRVVRIVRLGHERNDHTVHGELERSEGRTLATAWHERGLVQNPAVPFGDGVRIHVPRIRLELRRTRRHVEGTCVYPVRERHDAERSLLVPGVVRLAIRIEVPALQRDLTLLDVADGRSPGGHEARGHGRVGLPGVASIRDLTGVAASSVEARVRLTGVGRPGITGARRRGRGGRRCAACSAGSGIGLHRLPAEVQGRTLRTGVRPRALVPVVRVSTKALKDRDHARVVATVHAEADIDGHAAVVAHDALDVQTRRRTGVRSAASAALAGRRRGGRCSTLPASPGIRRRCRAAGPGASASPSIRGSGRSRGRRCTARSARPGIRSDVELVVCDVARERAARTVACRERLRVAVVARDAAGPERVRVLAAVEPTRLGRLIQPAERRVRARGAEVAPVELGGALDQVLVRRIVRGRASRERERHRHEGNDEETDSSHPVGLAHGHSPFPR